MVEGSSGAGLSQQAAPSASAFKATPRSGKSHGGVFAQTILRPAIAREMVNEILECPIDAFLQHYAPFYPSDYSVNTVREELEKSQLKKVGRGSDKVWALAPYVKPPRDIGDTESTVFEDLKKIISVLEEVGYADEDGTLRNRLFSYKNCPSNNMASEIEGTNFKVDACITSDPDAKTVILSDAVAVAEFKKKSDPDSTRDNRLKLISAAAQILNDDPRRMWVYGITIEDTQMAVWYFCRSHSVKSGSFNFTRDIQTFIRVFLSLLYPTTSEIGYDPTVHRVVHNQKICYVYEVGTAEAPRYYRTIEPLFTARVLCITGRKTRVWKVVQVKGPDKDQLAEEIGGYVVLKDGWLDEGSRSEQQNQDAIFERLKNIQSSDYNWASGILRNRLAEIFQDGKYRGYFMEILESRRIGKTKSRLQSATPAPHVLLFPEPTPTTSRHTVEGSTQSKDISGLPAAIPSFISGQDEEDNLTHREYKTKEQHRLVYRNVGRALNNAEDLLMSFRAIEDTFIALVLLYLAGWIHRDISAGNIIVVGSGSSARGKLSDLEYAKDFNDDNSSADPKTGTPFFMPYEIHQSAPLYVPIRALPSDDQEYNPLAPDNLQESQQGNKQHRERRHLKFRFQHDLESLWWVILWIVLYRVGGAAAVELAGRIFRYSSTPSLSRRTFFLEQFPDLDDHIDSKLLPLTPRLVKIQNILLNSYLSKEQTENLRVHAEYAGIYQQMWVQLSYLTPLVEQIENITLQDPDPEPKAPTKNNKKRSRAKSKLNDEDDYRPSRRGSAQGKTAPTEPLVNRPKRRNQIPWISLR